MKKLMVGILVLLLLTSTVACATSKGVNGSNSSKLYPATVTMTTVPMITPRPAITITSKSSQDSGSLSPAGMSGEMVIDRMIVRTGDITMLVEDITNTIERIKQLADQHKGYVVSSQSWQSDERLFGNISIRVPADDYDTVLKAIGNLAVEVTSQTTNSQDVTEEYSDLSAKLKNLEAAEQQLLQIMKQAVKVEDVLAVQKELTNTRAQIEQTKGRMQYLERTSSMSLITINLQMSKLTAKITANKGVVKAGEIVTFIADISGGFTPYSYEWDFGDSTTSTNGVGAHQYKSKGIYTCTLKVTDDKGNSVTETRKDYITVISSWDAGTTASSAWHGLVAFGRGLTNVLIWLGIFSPVWLIIGAITFWQYRRRKDRKKALIVDKK